MSITAKELVKMKKDRPEWKACLDHLLVKGLSRQQKKVFSWVGSGYHCDTRYIAGRAGISIFHAATILKKLFDMGLVSRKAKVDNVGKHYLYSRGN